jgi:hypothetical protein
MTEWNEQTRTIKTFSIRIGQMSGTLHERGKCPSGACRKWTLSAPPLIIGREIEADTEEDAKEAALAILRTELTTVLKQLSE